MLNNHAVAVSIVAVNTCKGIKNVICNCFMIINATNIGELADIFYKKNINL